VEASVGKGLDWGELPFEFELHEVDSLTSLIEQVPSAIFGHFGDRGD
jgi:hypothetical protein